MDGICPECGTPLEFDEVDIGVGVQRGNYGCPECHWTPKILIEPMLKEDEVDDLKFDLIFKRGPEIVATIHGAPRPFDGLQVGDVTNRIVETEQYLERLTGLRVHIETAEE